jgi:hypothetical protein
MLTWKKIFLTFNLKLNLGNFIWQPCSCKNVMSAQVVKRVKSILKNIAGIKIKNTHKFLSVIFFCFHGHYFNHASITTVFVIKNLVRFTLSKNKLLNMYIIWRARISPLKHFSSHAQALPAHVRHRKDFTI